MRKPALSMKTKMGTAKVKRKSKKKLKETKKKPKTKRQEEIESEETTHDDLENVTPSGHKKQLSELAEKDPEFYKFLKQQDADLLQFDESDPEVDDDDLEVEDERTAGNEEGLRTDSSGRKIIDTNFVKDLEILLLEKERPEPSVVRRVVVAFTACVARVGADIEPPGYVINDGSVFESVVRLCFTQLGKSLYSLLGPIKNEDKRKDSKASISEKHTKKHFRRWKKHSALVKNYLHGMSLFLNEVQTPNVIVCTLRAIIDLLDLYVYFPKLARNLTKAVIRIWSRKTDECRCAAFMALCKLVRIHKNSYPTVIKWCYLGYVTNVRDVNTESWPLILFMQKSFAEMCMIYPEIAYQYTFVYIRQTAIHLRNAMIAKRKDLIQTVYNWQFIQCLYLWTQVICKAHRHRVSTGSDAVSGIEELAYPLCQITTSAMKLFPSLKYLPLRMHCLRMLLTIQVNCQLYIPTLALAVELLSDATLILKKKPARGKGTLKGVEIKCILKATTTHLEDAGFRQAAIEGLFRIHLEAAHVLQQSCAFPDAIIPLNHPIKAFVKSCRNPEFARLFKSLETKLKEQSSYTQEILNTTSVNLRDEALLRRLKNRFCSSEAPLTKFYNSWQNVWKVKEDAMNIKPAQPAVEKSDVAEQETKPVISAEVERSSLIKTKAKHEEAVHGSESKEDILEDLVLSDAES